MSSRFVFLIRWLGRVWNGCLVVVGVLEVSGPSDIVRPVPWHEWLGPVFLFGGAFRAAQAPVHGGGPGGSLRIVR